jgi:hypothetical protein
MLASGDFFDGELKAIEGNRIRLSSVLFGSRSFELGKQAVALILGDTMRPKAPFIIRLNDGSVITSDSIELEKDSVKIIGNDGKSISVNANNIFQIRRAEGDFDSLADLKPIDNAAYSVDQTTVGLPMNLRGVDDLERGIGASAPGKLTYKLDKKYKSFLATAGVPLGILPTQHVHFVITIDGRRSFKSPELTSIDAPISIGLPLQGKSELTLESQSDSPLPVPVLWGDPLLVKQ